MKAWSGEVKTAKGKTNPSPQDLSMFNIMAGIETVHRKKE